MQTWFETVAQPQINARRTKSTVLNESTGITAAGLKDSQLDEVREILQSLQNDEQIILNQQMQEQEWAAQATQILDLVTKLKHTVTEMEKEKKGYLLTGQSDFADAAKRAVTDFYGYYSYLN